MELLIGAAAFIAALIVIDSFAAAFGADTRWNMGDDHRRVI